MKQLFYFILLVCITLSCKNSSLANKSDENVNSEPIDSLIVKEEPCYVDYTGDKIHLAYFGYNKVLNANDLNFITHQLDDVKINCSDKDVVVNYYENIGNQHIQTSHILDKNDTKFVLSKVYKFQSDRNGIGIYGLKIQNEFLNYSAIEPDLENIEIYSFTGFQKGLTPSITSYFNRIKSLFKKKDKSQLIFMGNNIVISHLINNIGIENYNIVKYNDIAYYLEQSGAYIEATFILEKIIKKFPNRTVAYINLGDAYWGNNEQEKARLAYKEYVKQMKKTGKENKIPKQVFDRIKLL